MNKKIKKEWIKALTSGEYTQTRETLVADNNKSMCCLGVLCHIQGFTVKAMKGHVMPSDVAKSACGGLRKKSMSKLVNMNDDQEMSFKQIAKHIQKHY